MSKIYTLLISILLAGGSPSLYADRVSSPDNAPAAQPSSAKAKAVDKAGKGSSEGPNKGSKGKKSKKSRKGHWTAAPACVQLKPKVASIVGAGKAECYIKLFFHETTCQAHLKQAKGNAGNAHAGYGLCSLERDPAVRRGNNRGPKCANISTAEHQIRCCQAIMKKTPHYFGPVNRGEVPRCG